MTIDSRMMSSVAYQDEMRELVNDILFDVYEDLSEMHLDKNVVQFHDLIEFTYSDIFVDIRDRLVAESIARKDYELYDLSKDNYVLGCYSGSIEDDAVIPHIEQAVLRTKIIEAINENCLFIQDGTRYENQPLTGVW